MQHIKAKNINHVHLTLQRKESLAGYLFIAPTMLGFVVFALFPTIAVIVLSLYKWDLIGTPVFIGINNYLQLFSSPKFYNTIKVTALYVLYNLPLQFIAAFFLALALKNITKGQKFFRTLILLPWITTPIAISIIWKWMLAGNIGLINNYLDLLGFGQIDFLSSGNALKTAAGISIWQYVGFCTLLFYIGLQSIPKENYEAAKVDGVNAWGQIIHITLPLLKPTILYQTITGIIYSFQVFDIIYSTTKGGPGEATNVMYFSIYQEAFSFLNMGYAASMCVVLFIILLVFTILQLRLFRDKN